MDDNEEVEYGYSQKGIRCYGEKVSRRSKRTTFIAAYSPLNKGLCATFCFEGYTNSHVFLIWIQKCLLPEISTGVTIMMDNASFHHTQEVKDSIESSGCFLEYLPSYSPDLNPIEKQWANVKRKIRKKKEEMSFDEAVEKSFKEMRQPESI